MIQFKSKEDILKLYVSRYPELDAFAQAELEKEYDYFIKSLKDCTTREEVAAVFEEKIIVNEGKYRRNPQITGVESSPCKDFYQILANYGMIVFFRDNILKD
ncbi:hypothetical protein [Alkaliphilus peptidifermentans]|uniref:Uncharacterized protein n=1 Tax=Alkaliphilus peptidifermentans DSM 18978 TaxID=1120976 RepID=A0A1G5AE70_9FIRM|nr:hypothetical protein [Alkaliphilus peptidifermentans]SCX76167.1 hypothetical protein SAMN03080606_00085 [Alkaliphilus peptidifermentans DSM 18978]